jgi:hypothetical protein
MTSESGVTAVAGFLNTSVIQKVLHWYLLDANPAQMHSYIQPIGGQGTDTAAFKRVTKQTALSGTITDTTGMSNTEFQAAKVTAAVSEVGILRQLTGKAMRLNSEGPEGLVHLAAEDGLKMVLEKFETDIWATFANASTSVGSTGQAFTAANFAAAVSQLHINKAFGPVVAMLTGTQAKNLRSDIITTGAAIMSHAGNDLMKPVTSDGFCGVVFGVPVYTNNLATTANGAVDKVGCLMIDGNAAPSLSPYGVALGWMPEVVQLSQPAFSGGAQIGVTMAYGMIEVIDGAYTQTITVA